MATIRLKRRNGGEPAREVSTALRCVKMRHDVYDAPGCALSITERADGHGGSVFFGEGASVPSRKSITLAELQIGDVAFVKETSDNLWWPNEIVADVA